MEGQEIGLKVGTMVNQGNLPSGGSKCALANAQYRRENVEDVESAYPAMIVVRPTCGATSFGPVLYGDGDTNESVRTRLAEAKMQAKFPV